MSACDSNLHPYKPNSKKRKGRQDNVPKSFKSKSNPRRWTKEEDAALREAVAKYGERNWKTIADTVEGRSHTQCLQRWAKVLKPGLVKGTWTPVEDQILLKLVTESTDVPHDWSIIAVSIPGRTSKQVRERWCNHLDPSIKKGNYTASEDATILAMQTQLGNRWSVIATKLHGRTEDAVKIRWKSLMRRNRQTPKSRRPRKSPEPNHRPELTHTEENPDDRKTKSKPSSIPLDSRALVTVQALTPPRHTWQTKTTPPPLGLSTKAELSNWKNLRHHVLKGGGWGENHAGPDLAVDHPRPGTNTSPIRGHAWAHQPLVMPLSPSHRHVTTELIENQKRQEQLEARWKNSSPFLAIPFA